MRSYFTRLFIALLLTNISLLAQAQNPCPPTSPSFTASANNVCGSVPINFTITSPDPNMAYTWNFGDTASGSNNTASGLNTSHAFTPNPSGATYTVTAIATPTGGNAATWTNIDPDLTVLPNGDLTKTSGSNWWNAGAISNELIYDDHYMEFSAPTTNSRMAAGLGIGNAGNDHFNTIDFAFRFENNGTIRIYESGANRGTFGNYAYNDVMRVAVEGGVVNYYQNGNLLYTSNNTPSFPMFVDLSIRDNTDTLRNVISGASCTATSTTTVTTTPTPLIEVTGDLDGCIAVDNLGFTNSVITINPAGTYTLDWGDGTGTTTVVSNGSNQFVHTYNAHGIYTITVDAPPIGGCSGTWTHDFLYLERPSADMVALVTDICEGDTVFTLNNTDTTNIDFYVWEWGDGTFDTTLTADSAFHVYTFTDQFACTISQTGFQYDITLHAYNRCFEHTNSSPINVIADPRIAYNAPTIVCESLNDSAGVVFNSVICPPPPDALSDLNYYVWTFGDSASVGDTAGFGYSNATHQFTNSGTFLVNVQVLSQCEVFNDSFTVTVLEEPRANANFTFNATSIPSNTTFGDACAPAIITMNNNSTGDSLEYNWMIQTNVIGGFNFTGGTSATSDNPQIEFTQAGDYIITLTTTSPCTSSTWIDTVTILGDPDVNLDPPTPTCDTFYYTPSVTYGTGGGQITSYQWSFPGGTPSTSTDSFPTNIEYIGAGPYTATVVVNNECGTASAQVTFDIELAPSPVSITNGNANLCLNDSPFNLTATPAGGTWSGTGIIDPSNGTFDPSVAGVGTHNVYYTYQPGNCPAVVETTVTVQDLPNVSAGSLQSTCVTGGILTLTGGSPAGGTWSGPGVNSTNGTFDPSVTGIGFIDVTYTYTDPSSCTNSATKQIEVYGLPALNLAGNQIQCNGSGNIQLTFSPTGGTWSGTGIVDPNLGTFNAQTAGGLGTYTLTYTYTDANGCTASDNINVQVVNSTVASVGPDETRCVNDPSFALTTGTPAGGFWAGPGVIATSSTTYSFFPDIAGPGVHDVVYVYGNGSCEERDSMQVTVTDTIPINPIADLTLCTLSDPVVLTATPSGGTWTGPGVTGSTFYPFASPGNYVLTYTYTDPSTQCSSVATKNITILPPPFVTTTGSLTECNSSNLLTLTGATPPGGVWSGPGIVDANAGTFNSIQAGGVGTHIVTYTYTDNAGCPGSANLVVNILAGDNVSAGPDTVLCIDATSMALLNGTPAGGTWSGAGVSGSTFFPSVVGVGTHEIYYTTGTGTCQRSDTSIVTVSGPPVVNAGPDATVCIFSQPTNLIGTPFGGTWTGTGVVNNVFYPFTAGTGVYTLTYTYIDPVTQCARTDDRVMQVTTSPSVNAGGPELFCLIDGDITLTNYGPAGGFWAGPGITDPVAGTFNPTLAGGLGHGGTDTTYYLIYNFSGGNNCNGTDILVVTLTAGDTVSAGFPEEVCHLDDPFELSGFSPPGGLWSGPGIIDANDGVFDPSAVSPGVYEVIYTAGTGSCAFSDTTTVTVGVVPTVEAGPDEVICVGTSAYTLTGNSPLGDGTWSGIGITDPNIGIFDPNIAGIGTHTLTYSYTDISSSAGCSAFDTKTVTITPLPTLFLPDTLEYCYISQNIVLTGYTPIGGVWSGPGIVSPSGIFNADTAGGLGNYLVHYLYNAANGCNVEDSLIISIGSTVSVAAGTGGSFCITDGATTLQGASPSGGAWSGPGIINPSTGLFNPPLAGVGFHQIVYTIGTGTCEVSDTVLVEVGDLPVVTSAPVNDYCEFDRPDTLITLSQAGIGYTPIGGYWTGTGITDSTLGIFDPSVAGSGSHVITYTYTVPSTGCTSSASNFVVVNAAPIVNAGDTVSFCNANGSVQLTNFTPINGNWTGVGVIDGANGLFNPFIAGLGTHHLVYSVASVNGCIGSDTLVVVVEGDTIDVGPDLNVCIDNGLVTLGPVTPTGGIWSGSGIIDPNGIFDPQLVGVNSTTTLTYTVTNGICTLTDQLNLFVSPPLTVVAGPDDSLCVSQGAYQLTGFAPFPGGIWTGIGITDSTGIFDPGLAGVGTHTLTYSYEVNATGCAGTDTKQVVVTPPPNVDAGDTLSYCNSTSNITLTGYSPLGGVWSMVGGGPGIIDNINGIFNPQVAGGVGTYQLLYEATFGACTNRDTLVVDVIFGDTVEAGPNDTVCINDPLLQLTGFSPVGGTWSGTAVIDPINGIFDPVSAGAGVHILSYTYGTGSCQKTDTKIVLVGNLPVLNAGPDETVCINNGPFLLTGFSPQGGIWSGFGITDSINGRFDPTLTGLGTFTATYTFVNAITGCENTDTKIIDVVPLPTVVVLDTVIYCNTNADITLNGFAPTGGTWSGLGIVNANGIFNANLAGGIGTYNLIYRYENGNNCSDQDTMVVQVIEGDTVEAGPAQFTCIDAGLYNITGFSPFGGTWTGTGIVDQQAGTFDPQVAGTGFHTLVYTYGVGTCEKSDSTTIFVGDPPAVIAGPDLDVCFNATPFTINSASPSGGYWTGLGVDSSGLFTPSTVGVGNYALVYTFVNSLTGCSNQDTLEVDILPPPVVEAGGPVVYCNTTQNITLTGYSPTGGLWSGPGIVDGINGIFNANTAGGIGSYQLVYTYNGIIGGCGGIDTLQVDIIFGDTVDAGLPDTLCIDDGPFVLSGYVPTTQGTWSGTGITDAALGIFDPQTAGTGTHTLTYTHGVGSCRKSDTKTVFVSALPIITAGPDETVCINTPSFTFAGFTPQGGIWSGIGIVDANTGLFDPSIAGVGSFTMTYSYTDPITNCNNVDTKIVNITPLPQVTAGGSVIYCDNPNQITLTNYSPTGGVWTGNGIVDGNNGIFSTVLAGGIGSHELYYTVTDPNGCAATDTLTVDIIFGDTVLAGTNEAICIDAGLITLTDFQPAGGTWSGNGITDPLGIFNPTVAGVGTHVLTYTYGTGTCQKTANKSITVNNPPLVSAGVDETVCEDALAFQMQGFSPVGGTWSGIGITDTALGIFDPQAVGIGTYTITYTFVNNATGCTAIDDKLIIVAPLPIVDAGDTIEYCNTSDNITLIATPTGGVWSGPGIVDANLGIFNTTQAGGLGTYTLTYTMTDSNSCVAADDLIVNVIFGDTVTAGTAEAICIDAGLITFNDFSPPGGTWSGNGIIDPIVGIFDPQLAGLGNHLLTYTFGAGTCQKESTKTVFVGNLPIVEAGPSLSMCIDEPILQLQQFSPIGGTWQGVGITDSVLGLFDPLLAGAGTHTIRYSFFNGITGCEDFDTRTIRVNPLPVVSGPDSLEYCNTNVNITLSGYTPLGGTWTGQGIVDPNNGVFNTAVAGGVGNYDIIYSYTDINGCEASDTTNINVVFGDTVEAGPDLAVCIDDPQVVLTGFSPIGGTWSGSGIVDPAGVFDPQAAVAGQFNVLTYTFGTGTCQKTDTRIIFVGEIPNVVAGPDQAVCQEETAFNLTAFSPPNGFWTGFGITDSSGVFDPQVAGVGNWILTYTYVDPTTGCENFDTKTIEVQAPPAVDAGAPITYCNSSNNIPLTNFTPAGGIWSGAGIVDALNGIWNPLSAGGLGAGGADTTYPLVYTYTNIVGCFNRDTLEITLIFGDTVYAGAPDTVCIDEPQFSLVGYTPTTGGTWTGPGIIDPIFGIFDPATAGVGLHTISYTFGTGTCEKTDDKTIFVGSLPLIDPGLDEVVCIDEGVFNLSSFSPQGGTWTGIGITDPSGVFDPQLAGIGTHILTYTFTNSVTGCDNLDTKTIQVVPLPTVFAGDSVTYCNTTSDITLSNYSPAGGTWSGPGIVSSNLGLFSSIIAGGIGSYDLVYTFTDGNGCTNRDTLNVEIIFGDTVLAGQNLNVCIDDAPFTLTGNTPPSGGTWSGPGIIDAANGIFDPVVAGAGTHTVIWTFGTGTCEKTSSRTIFVGTIPIVDAGPDLTICEDVAPFQLLGNSPIGGVWAGSGITDSIVGIFDPAVTGVGTYTIVYTFTNVLTGCENQDTRTIQVVPLPTVVVDDTIEFCINNNNVTLSAFVNWNPTGGSWSGPGVVDPATGLFNATIAGGLATGGADTSFTLTYTYTDNNGCGNSDILLVNLTFGDTVEAGPNDTLCLDDNPILLTGFSPAGGTWSGNGVDPLGTFDPLAAGVGTHTLTYTFGTGTCLKSDTRQIVVGAPPTINIGPDQTVCIDASAFTLTGYSPQGGTWSGVGITDPNAGIFDPTTAGVGSHVLTYTFRNSLTDCESSAIRTITVAPLPTVFAGDSVTYCANPNDITLTGYSPVGGTWSGPGIVSSNLGLFSPIIAGGIGTYDLVYTFTDGNGCTNSDTLNVEIIFGDTVTAGQNMNVCIDDGQITLTGNTPPTGGTWSGPGIIDAANGIFDPIVAGTGTHTVTWTFGTGTCEKTSSRTIFVGTVPIVDAGPDLIICEDVAPFQLLGNSPIGGVWAGSGITDSIVGIFDPAVTGVGTYTISNVRL